MDTLRTPTAIDRDRAIARLRRLTLSTAAAALAGTLGFGALTAATGHASSGGTSAAGTAQAASTTTASTTTGSAASSRTTTGSTSTSSTPQTIVGSLTGAGSGSAQVSSGGS
ncbi:MAG TPA: hypothetical protein VF763_10420 [Candidatus Limnocylindrales bacterium]